jgi:acyl-CoA thioesterase FadM
VNLLLRLLWLAVAGGLRRAVPVLGPCRTPFRVWPTDLDVLRHVNNGVYFSIMDVARVDLMRRAGLWKPILARGWYPVAVAETIQFRRALTLFQRFDIVTRVLAWDDKAFLIEQRFERAGATVAVAYVRARFLARSGDRVAPTDLLALAGVAPDAVVPGGVPEAAARWNEDFAAWRPASGETSPATDGERAASAKLPDPRR